MSSTALEIKDHCSHCFQQKNKCLCSKYKSMFGIGFHRVVSVAQGPNRAMRRARKAA